MIRAKVLHNLVTNYGTDTVISIVPSTDEWRPPERFLTVSLHRRGSGIGQVQEYIQHYTTQWIRAEDIVIVKIPVSQDEAYWIDKAVSGLRILQHPRPQTIAAPEVEPDVVVPPPEPKRRPTGRARFFEPKLWPIADDCKETS